MESNCFIQVTTNNGACSICHLFFQVTKVNFRFSFFSFSSLYVNTFFSTFLFTFFLRSLLSQQGIMSHAL